MFVVDCVLLFLELTFGLLFNFVGGLVFPLTAGCAESCTNIVVVRKVLDQKVSHTAPARDSTQISRSQPQTHQVLLWLHRAGKRYMTVKQRLEFKVRAVNPSAPRLNHIVHLTRYGRVERDVQMIVEARGPAGSCSSLQVRSFREKVVLLRKETQGPWRRSLQRGSARATDVHDTCHQD